MCNDGVPTMFGKRNGRLKLLKDENPELFIIHCVIHRENLISKKSSLVLNEILNSVVICVNSIKSNAKSERLFKKFCESNDANNVRLILNTNIRWLSKGN